MSYQSKYGELLNVIEDLGREVKPTYAGSKMAQERLKKGKVLRDRKHPTRQFCKISVPGDHTPVSWKIVYLFSQNFKNAHLENLICSLCYFFLLENLLFSRNFGQDLLENRVFLWYFFVLENCMWSCGISRKLSLNFWCVLVHFAFLENLHVFLYHFWFSWKIWWILIKELCLLLENSYVFLLHASLLQNLMCSRNLFKKVAPEKKQIFWRNSSPAASERYCYCSKRDVNTRFVYTNLPLREILKSTLGAKSLKVEEMKNLVEIYI